MNSIEFDSKTNWTDSGQTWDYWGFAPNANYTNEPWQGGSLTL